MRALSTARVEVVRDKRVVVRRRLREGMVGCLLGVVWELCGCVVVVVLVVGVVVVVCRR